MDAWFEHPQASGGDYDLQFARRRIMGNISGGAPFETMTALREMAARTLAERWYAVLPNQ